MSELSIGTPLVEVYVIHATNYMCVCLRKYQQYRENYECIIVFILQYYALCNFFTYMFLYFYNIVRKLTVNIENLFQTDNYICVRK